MVVTRGQSGRPSSSDAASRTSSAAASSPASASASRPKGKGVDKPASSAKVSGAGSAPNGTLSKSGHPSMDDVRDGPSIPLPPPPKLLLPAPKLKPRTRKSTKAKRRHYPNKGISIFDILARLFLLWLTIYTLSVCPDDVALRSPVCRALTEYRRIILEPYIYPPIRAALDHPSIAPHIQRAQPYYTRAVQTTTPWIRRGTHEWHTRVAPRLHRLQLRARPYLHRAQRQYDAALAPHVHRLAHFAAQCQAHAAPHLRAAALKTRRKWQRARPFVGPLWRGAGRVPGVLARVVGAPLGEARRRWVDPQVAKIWAAVVEKGRAGAVNGGGSPAVASSSASSAPSAASTAPLSNESPTSTGTLSVDAVSLSSGAGAPVPEPTDAAAASASSIVVDSASAATTSAEDAANTTLSQPSAEPSLTDDDVSPPAEDEVVDADLEDFLSEIGADEPEVPTEEPPPPPPVHEETEEEKAERLRLQELETAEKRADIEGRHDRWERDLETLGKAQRKVVRATLGRLREAAVEEAGTPGGAIRVHVETLAREAEKSLKSLKAYAKKLAGEDRSEEEKEKAWDSIVGKVDKKFGERVDAAADAVREWWREHVNQEIREVLAIGEEVGSLALQAQADLGMDYSWLLDVTYEDWQRYHKLVDSKRFTDLYLSMQNGTHANAPPNPLTDVMEALQEEVDDMIMGFDANLTRVKSAALDGFSGTETRTSSRTPSSPMPTLEAMGNSGPEVSILPVEPVTGGPPPSPPKATEPTVSILPIEPVTGEREGGEIPPVVLSRGAEEVRGAVSRAEEARTRGAREEL